MTFAGPFREVRRFHIPHTTCESSLDSYRYRFRADGCEAFVIVFGHIRFAGFPCEDSLAIASCLHGYLEGMYDTHSDITGI